MVEIRVGIVGFGSTCKTFHVPFLMYLKEKFKVVSISQRDPSVVNKEAKSLFPEASFKLPHHGTKPVVLEDEGVDVVFILTTNDTHFDLCKKALLNGKHVLVEKPMTTTYQEALILCDLAEERNLILTVFQNRRFDGDFMTLKNLQENNRLGRIVRFESRFERFRLEPKTIDAWRERPGKGTGILYDLGSHLIDQAICLFGTPKSVFCISKHQRLHTHVESPPDDYFQLSLTYSDSPLVVQLTASMVSCDLSRFRLDGTEASYIKKGLDPQEARLKSQGSQALLNEGFGREDSEEYGTLYTKPAKYGDSPTPQTLPTIPGSYMTFFENLYDAISKKDSCLLVVKPREGAVVIQIIEAAVESSKTVPLLLIGFGHSVTALTNQDYILLRDSIKEFIKTNGQGPDRNIPLLVRAAFHDVATANPSKGFGSVGCLLTVPAFQNALGMAGLTGIVGQLKSHVTAKFPNTAASFSSGDILSLAGKVAIETANPCMRIDWSFGRPECSRATPPDVLPPGLSHKPEDYYGPLQRYNLSFLEMGILIAGGHGLKGAKSTGASAFTARPLATQNSGKSWLVDTFKFDWTLNWFNVVERGFFIQCIGRQPPPNAVGCLDGGIRIPVETKNYEMQAGGLTRFPSDFVLFPSTAEKLGLSTKSNEFMATTSGVKLGLSSNQLTKDTESELQKFTQLDRSVFDMHFERVFAKMLLIGVDKPELLTKFVETEPRVTVTCTE